jgi:hypothetical protein
LFTCRHFNDLLPDSEWLDPDRGLADATHALDSVVDEPEALLAGWNAEEAETALAATSIALPLHEHVRYSP